MVIETDGQFLFSADFLGSFAQRMQTCLCGTDGSQDSQDAKQDQNPEAQGELTLQPDAQIQKKDQGENCGEAELADPHDQV